MTIMEGVEKHEGINGTNGMNGMNGMEEGEVQQQGTAVRQGSTSTVVSDEDREAARAAKEAGNDAFKGKRYSEAVRLYSDAIASDPAEASYYTNRAAANMSLQNYRPALEDCNRANTLQSSSPNVKTLTRLARCHFQLGDLDSAKATLERALSIAPGDSTAETLLGQVDRTRQHIGSFYRYREEKSYQMANIALDKASAEVATVPLSWRLMRGDLLLRRGQVDKANGVASDALRLFPNDPEALVLRARVLIEVGSDLNRAVQHGQAALRADPEHRAAALLIRRCRKMERAKEEANAAFKAGETENAVQLYTQAVTLADEGGQDGSGQANGFKAILFSNRATANSKLGKHQEAVDDCNQSLELNPGFVKALRTRARAHLAMERYEDAVSDFKKAVEETPGGEAEALKRELRSAEIDLKRSKKKDYYKILGVEKTATAPELKKAYRKESLKHHPDKGGDEEKFKLCNEAFGVLSDPQKRRRYDLGADDDDLQGMGGFGGGGDGVEVNLADLFSMGGGGGMGGMGGMHGMHGSSFSGAGGPFGAQGGFGRRPGARPPPGFSFG